MNRQIVDGITLIIIPNVHFIIIYIVTYIMRNERSFTLSIELLRIHLNLPVSEIIPLFI